MKIKRCKIVNIYGGPGTGKSTCAGALFADLKYSGENVEYIQEYAKDAAWEKRGPKVFEAQEYIFGKQHFRMARVADDVDYLVTDSPILLGLAYMPIDFYLPSLPLVIKEAYDNYDNLDIFLVRKKAYNPKGRNQNEAEARELDVKINLILDKFSIPYHIIPGEREAIKLIRELMFNKWGTAL